MSAVSPNHRDAPTHDFVWISRRVHPVPMYVRREEVWPQLGIGDALGVLKRVFGGAESSERSPSREARGQERGGRCKSLPPEDSTLIFGGGKCLFGDVRRVSSLGAGFLAALFLLSGFFTARSFGGALGVRERPKAIWAAGVAAGLIGVGWNLCALTSGWLWITWV